MRLIDGNALMDKICKRFNIPDDWDGDIAEPLQTVIDIIDNEPTAYDTENVIEQLNDLPTFKVSATSEKHPFCAYEAEMISKHKVIGIVKKGGV